MFFGSCTQRYTVWADLQPVSFGLWFQPVGQTAPSKKGGHSSRPSNPPGRGRLTYCDEALLARVARGRGFSGGGSSLLKKLKMLLPPLLLLGLLLPPLLLVATPSNFDHVTVTLAPTVARGYRSSTSWLYMR